MDIKKVLFWVSTVVMCGIFLFSAGMYLTKYEMVQGFYEHLGFPIWIIYPLAIAKILGVIAIISNKSALLREWAYAGFFYDAVLAFAAHTMAGDGSSGMAVLALVGVVVSRALQSAR